MQYRPAGRVSALGLGAVKPNGEKCDSGRKKNKGDEGTDVPGNEYQSGGD